MIEWVREPSSLGLFNEATVPECMASAANKDACYTAAVVTGAGGWNLILAPYLVDICMNEACGRGIILTPNDMQKAGAVIGTCMQQCVDDAQKLPDNGARQAALAACPTTCNMAHVLEQVHAQAAAPPTTPPKQSGVGWWLLGGLAALVGGYFLVKGGGAAAFANPALRQELQLLPPSRSKKQFWKGYRAGYQDWQRGATPITEEQQAKHPRLYGVGYWMGYRGEYGEP